MLKSLHKYKMVYGHLRKTYWKPSLVRASYLLQILSRLAKLVGLPIAISVIVTKLAAQDYTGAYRGVWIFVIFSSILGILSPLVKYIGMRGENPVYHTLTGHYFDKLVHADIDYFNDNLTGYLTTATRQYADATLEFVRAIRDRYFSTILSIVLPLIVIAWIDIWLGLAIFCVSLLQAVYLIWASKIIDPYRAKSRELYKQNSGRMSDIISNIVAVRSNAQEKNYIARVRAGATDEGSMFTLRYAVQSKLIAVREIITVLFNLSLLWLIVHRAEQGAISLQSAVLAATYLATILVGIYALSDDLDNHDDFVDKIVPAFEILGRDNTIVDPKKAEAFAACRGDISFKSVYFSYGASDKPVLKGLTLDIPHGQKVGIVGLSGAGKSTITKLLLRFNDVTVGSITIDGHDVRNVRQSDLRAQIAYVPQEPLLFHASIRENILVGKLTASDKEILSALKAAHADKFIKRLPDGLNSIVGERGVKLSGGQKQRIAIARAVLRQAPIMILDEATSALDSESEQIIKDSFKDILKGKTAIVVAHRLSTLSEMDRIVVIENGACIEDGTHEALLKASGSYARLWKRQQRHDETD